jgi:hypothetical protein
VLYLIIAIIGLTRYLDLDVLRLDEKTPQISNFIIIDVIAKDIKCAPEHCSTLLVKGGFEFFCPQSALTV